MRRNYISPEFDYNRVYGTFNSKEESSFLGSKMLEIDDVIILDNQSIVYYQNLSSEQIDLSIENSLPPIVYSASDDKKTNHTLEIDNSQSNFQRDGSTRYIMSIDLMSILNNYLFGVLKEHRTFEGVTNQMCYSGDVDFSIRQYISRNVIDRYKFEKLDLYLKYNDLGGQNLLRFNNSWNDQIATAANQMKKFETNTDFDDSSIIVTFNQEKKSTLYSFDYYFKLYWVKL